MTSRTERLGRRLEISEEKISYRLRLMIFALLFMLFLVIVAMLFRYMQTRNEAPQSYYDFQVAIWRAEVSRNPNNPKAHVNLGYIYTKMSRFGPARYELERAIDLDKHNPVSWYYLGLLNRRAGDKKAAIKNLNTAIKNAADGNKFLPLYELADIYADAGNEKKAIPYLEKSVKDQPIMWNVHYRLGELYEKTGDKDKALVQYKEAQKFNKSKKINDAVNRLSSGAQ